MYGLCPSVARITVSSVAVDSSSQRLQVDWVLGYRVVSLFEATDSSRVREHTIMTI